jgi:hypothetical protein
VYDPDPISTLRRRRISNDSLDSGSGERHYHLQQRPPQMAPLTCYVASSSQLTPTKRQRPSPKPGSNRGSSISPASAGTGGGVGAGPGRPKKRKKKHKHHRCTKHKHKKASKKDEDAAGAAGGGGVDADGNPLRIKLDGSFNNTTTYSIRSPMYQASRSEESTHDDEDTSEESSDDESPAVSPEKNLVFLSSFLVLSLTAVFARDVNESR